MLFFGAFIEKSGLFERDVICLIGLDQTFIWKAFVHVQVLFACLALLDLDAL